MVLTRSNVRSRDPTTLILSNSGEEDSGESDKFNTNITCTQYSNSDNNKTSSIDQDSSDVEVILDTDDAGQNLNNEDDLMTTIEADANPPGENLDNVHQINPEIKEDDFFN